MIEKEINGKTFLTEAWPLSKDLKTIILIHGAGCSSLFWKFQIGDLSDKFNIIAVDLPGHGRSSRKACTSVDEYAVFVEELIESLNIKSPFLMGHSMGGATAIKLLLRGKFEYQAAVIANSGAKLGVHEMIFDMIENKFDDFVRTFDFAAMAKEYDKERLSFLSIDLEKNGQETSFNDFKACSNYDVADRLGEISIPVLVFTGEEDKLTPKKLGKYLAEKIKNSVYINDLKSGHMAPAENPEEFNNKVKEFFLSLK